MKKNVLLGVTSGIAAFKVLDLIKLLIRDGINVNVIMTPSASKIVNASDIEKLTGNPVYRDLFEKDFDYKKVLKTREVEHINLADNTSIFVIVPATANTIGKLAYGIADDYLTTTALAITVPTIICPSMNVNMWNNPAVQDNIKLLEKRGYQILGPDSGMLACGYEGAGRLVSAEDIKEEILKNLKKSNSLSGKKIIVTSGGTKEKIDDVRFITNRSSGKMGVAIAEESYLAGAEVVLIRSKDSVVPRYIMQEEVFETSDELFGLIKKHIKKTDIFFQVAAVSDFKSKPFSGKLDSDKRIELELIPVKKILNQLKKINPKMKLIAFKAECENDEKRLMKAAKKKLAESKADYVVANDISRKDIGFESDENEVIVISKDKNKKIKLSSKQRVAQEILDFINM